MFPKMSIILLVVVRMIQVHLVLVLRHLHEIGVLKVTSDKGAFLGTKVWIFVPLHMVPDLLGT